MAKHALSVDSLDCGNYAGIQRLEFGGGVWGQELKLDICEFKVGMCTTVVQQKQDVPSLQLHLVVDLSQPLLKDGCRHPALTVPAIQDWKVLLIHVL